MKKKYKIAIVLIVLIFNPFTLGVLWVGLGLWSNAHPDIGENNKRVRWLPEEATTISYYKNSWTAKDVISKRLGGTWLVGRVVNRLLLDA